MPDAFKNHFSENMHCLVLHRGTGVALIEFSLLPESQVCFGQDHVEFRAASFVLNSDQEKTVVSWDNGHWIAHIGNCESFRVGLVSQDGGHLQTRENYSLLSRENYAQCECVSLANVLRGILHCGEMAFLFRFPHRPG
jgi:hypothetical protein